MSSGSPETPAENYGTSSANVDGRFVKFPPFPQIPEGVTIILFRDFVPAGYKQIVPESGGDPIEVDGYGIPTIKVLSEEEVIQKKRLKKKSRNAGQCADDTGRIVPWWEEWEEDEESRSTGYPFSSDMCHVDRVHQAADDFRLGRTWPPLAAGVRLMWDHFRLYVGLVATMPLYRKAKGGNKNLGPILSDDEDDDNGPHARSVNPSIIKDPLEQMAHPGKELEPKDDTSDLRIELLKTFIDDVEKSTKIFFSSYMREKDLIWTDRNLSIAPTLMHFFLRFMLRNGVFSDSIEHEESLKRAMKVAKLAEEELPRTSRIAKVIPDKFHSACIACWGKQGGLVFQASLDAYVPPDINGQSPASDVDDNELDVNQFAKDLDSTAVKVIPSEALFDEGLARQIVRDNLEYDGQFETTTLADILAGETGGGSSESPADEEVQDDTDWTVMIDQELAIASWTNPSASSLFEFLGPTTLPLTHTTGIVEFSTRRVKEILPPASSPSPNTLHGTVEVELRVLFSSVVMDPWTNYAQYEDLDPDIGVPVIMCNSRGIAKSVPNDCGINYGGTCGDVDPMSRGDDTELSHDAFDAYTDSITVLVEPSVAEHLTVGMGLAGTWVEIAPQEGVNGELSEDRKRRPSERLWYSEDVVSVFPSFHTKSESV